MEDECLKNYEYEDFQSIVRTCLREVKGMMQLSSTVEFFSIKFEDEDLKRFVNLFGELIEKYGME